MVLMRATVASENLLTLGTRFYDHHRKQPYIIITKTGRLSILFTLQGDLAVVKATLVPIIFFSLCRKYLHFSNIGENL